MKSKAKRTMMQMGFSVSNCGFGYIVDALVMIHEEPDVKFGYMYEVIARRHKKHKSSVERAIRYEIENYYSTYKVHPVLDATNTKTGRYPVKEFLKRLYLIIYKPELAKEEE